MAEKRIVWVDYAKAIAIVLIVASHVQHRIFKMGLCGNSSLYHFVDSLLYSFHVPLFFFVSGIFLRAALRKRGLKAFTLNKLGSIMYPFIIWSLLQTGVEITVSHMGAGSIPWTELITCLYYPRAHFWFLYALFFMSIFSGLIYSASRRFGLTVLSALATLLFFASCLIDLGPFAEFGRYYIFFAAGVAAEQIGLIARISHRIPSAKSCDKCGAGLKKRVGGRILPAAAAVFAVVEYTFIILDWNALWFGRIILGGVGIFFSIAVAVAIAEQSGFGWLECIGTKTLPIYVAHVLAAYPVMQGIWILTRSENVTLYFVAGMLAGILLPLALDAVAGRFGLGMFFKLQPGKYTRQTVRAKRS
ncbi:MAG: acyltransferase family protein [Verrucomicrobiota bacterium]